MLDRRPGMCLTAGTWQGHSGIAQTPLPTISPTATTATHPAPPQSRNEKKRNNGEDAPLGPWRLRGCQRRAARQQSPSTNTPRARPRPLLCCTYCRCRPPPAPRINGSGSGGGFSSADLLHTRLSRT
ncbi:uncharacterized protein K452DRAFT_35493 [Aplosporella prunicola CBS 121167]|uniref:Uncharacterized protein n=1 Tax=Aplosporella prunicola CBS 121167 TaxID=1176127 RepID=A0A6A6AWH2_9PEZI|nr:uncharacterized protein K452DRAFT_35493 [Aplosporella prunicola CBS 121167]KAF2135294.1 hypothetical protein K452DRAFT_35493 [Aplosporella prunicola CBS 121167]